MEARSSWRDRVKFGNRPAVSPLVRRNCPRSDHADLRPTNLIGFLTLMLPRDLGIRILGWSAGLLILSGCLHAGVWVIQGGEWEGPVSWRKPILFGFSAGATAWSIAWLMPKLRPRPADGWLAAALAICLGGEVALITLQTWRGVASHFNRNTPFDAVVLELIGWLIVLVTGAIFELTRRTWGRVEGTSDIRLAIRVGMFWLSFSCLLGFWLVWHGERQLAQGLAPETFGQAGVMKFPHGVPMHAIQLLPLWAGLLRLAGRTEVTRWQSVCWASLGILFLTLYSLTQTVLGRARFDLHTGTATLLFLVGACFLLSLAIPWLPRLSTANPIWRLR